MKQSEVVNLSNEELDSVLRKLKDEYIGLKLSHLVTPLESPILLRSKRRILARLSTEISKRKNHKKSDDESKEKS